jgi:hypothetical protein
MASFQQADGRLQHLDSACLYLVRAAQRQLCGVGSGWPLGEEPQGVSEIREAFGVRQGAVLGLDIVEVGQTPKEGAQPVGGQTLLKGCPAQLLSQLPLAARFQGFEKDLLPVMDARQQCAPGRRRRRPGERGKGLIRPPRS